MELLKRVRVEVGDSLCRDASAKSVLAALSEECLNSICAFALDSSSLRGCRSKLLSFIEYEQDPWFDLEFPLAVPKRHPSQVNCKLLNRHRIRDRQGDESS